MPLKTKLLVIFASFALIFGAGLAPLTASADEMNDAELTDYEEPASRLDEAWDAILEDINPLLDACAVDTLWYTITVLPNGEEPDFTMAGIVVALYFSDDEEAEGTFYLIDDFVSTCYKMTPAADKDDFMEDAEIFNEDAADLIAAFM